MEHPAKSSSETDAQSTVGLTPPRAKALAHTALPWQVDLARYVPDAPVFGFAIRAEGRLPAICSAGIHEPHCLIPANFASADVMANYFSANEAEANAAFIVRACNSHYQLLEALKALLPLVRITDENHQKLEGFGFTSIAHTGKTVKQNLEAAEQAIAQAEREAL